MVQTQLLTMLGYVGSSCADNRLASSFPVWHHIFSFNVFQGKTKFLTSNSKFFIDICFFLIHTLCDFVENAYICSVIIDKLIEGIRGPG